MKKSKTLMSMIMAVMLLVSAIPAMAETPVITISDFNHIWDVTATNSFTADIPSGFSEARVIVGDEVIEELSPASSPYTIEVPANSLRAIHGTTLKVEADYDGNTISESCNLCVYSPTDEKINVFTQNFDEVQAAVDYAIEKYPTAAITEWNHTRTLGQQLGFANGFASGRAEYTQGVGADGSGALAVKGVTDNQAYLEYKFASPLTRGIVCLTFDVYMEDDQGLYPSMRFTPSGSMDYTLNAYNTTCGSWTTVKIYYDLYEGKMYYADIVDDFAPADGLSTFRFNIIPTNGKTILIDNLSIDFYYCNDPAPDVAMSDIEAFYDVDKDITFTADIPDGFEKAEVLYGDTVVKTIEASSSPYTVTIPANSLKAVSETKLTLSVDYYGKVSTDSQIIRTYKLASPALNLLNQNFDNIQAAIDYATKTYPTAATTAWNHTRTVGQQLGFSGGFAATNAEYTAGVGADGSAALAVKGVTDSQTYLQYPFARPLTKGILCLSFDVFMDNTQSMYPVVAFTNGKNVAYTLNKNNTVCGEWENVKLYYDLYSQKLYYGDIIYNCAYGEGFRSLRFNVTPKSGKTVLLDNFSIDFYPTMPALSVSPANGAYVHGPDVNIEAVANGATALKAAYINGVKIPATFSAEASKVTYSATGMEYGPKNLKLILEYSDGKLYTQTSDFTVVKSTGGVVSELYGTAVTYDDMAETATKAPNVTNYNSTISRISGPSGRADDYAPLFTHSGTSEASAYLLKTGFSTANWSTLGGYFVMEFDYYMNHSGKFPLWLSSSTLWGDSAELITKDGKIRGTNTTLSNGNWYNFRMVLDREANKWYVWVDGNLVVDGAERTKDGYNGSIYFRLRAGADTTKTSFGIDNVCVYNTAFEPSVISETASTIAKDTSSLSFDFNKDVAFTADNTELYVDGVITSAEVSSSGSAVTVTLPPLKANAKIKLVFKDGKANNAVCMNVANDDGVYLESDIADFSDSTANAIVVGDNIAADKTVKAVIAFYSANGTKLEGLEIKDVVLSAGSYVVTTSAKADNNADSCKFMIFDSINTVKPYAKAVEK